MVLLACPKSAGKSLRELGYITVTGSKQGEIKIRVVAFNCDTVEGITDILRQRSDVLMKIPKTLEITKKMALCNRTINDINSKRKEVPEQLKQVIRETIHCSRFPQSKMMYLKGIDPIDIAF